ncbi:hypothetical protein FXO38_05712 [Capsicum annuum]|nr:hypothetical protein FXO37_29293 [Capsicum annuum]KAF3673274.1 hypothetical protein FXO38_05712 [Capsicum annuum]
MAVMKHSYYGSFGYHVTNFFAASSRSGNPEDLKYLIDKARSLILQVLLDVVHSRASNNVVVGLNGFDMALISAKEVFCFLISNLRWWLEEYKFDEFRIDGITSMLYVHHGINMGFTGKYNEYFSEAADVDAMVYLIHSGTVSETVDVPVEEDAELSVNATERSVLVKRIDDLYSIRFTVSAIGCKDNDNDIEGPTTEKDVQVTEASQVKASRKRKRSFEVQDVIGDISIKFR